LNPHNLRAAYQLAQEIERQGAENSALEFQQVIEKILAAQPDNLAALLELGRIAAKRGDAGTLKSVLARLDARSPAWPPEAQQQLVAMQEAAGGTDLRLAATKTIYLRNVLMRVSDYRQSLAAIQAPQGDEAPPFTRFLALESPVFKPATADRAIAFEPEPLASFGDSRWDWLGAIRWGSRARAIGGNGRELRLSSGASFPFPGDRPALRRLKAFCPSTSTTI
jgi:hypothetical protein